MILVFDTGRCASEDAEPRRGVDCDIPHRLKKEMSVSEDAGPRRGVNCEIPHRLGRRMKNLEGKPERESPKRTIFASGGLGPSHARSVDGFWTFSLTVTYSVIFIIYLFLCWGGRFCSMLTFEGPFVLFSLL